MSRLVIFAVILSFNLGLCQTTPWQAEFLYNEGNTKIEKLPIQDNELLKIIAFSTKKKDSPKRFAVPLSVDIDPKNNGTWTHKKKTSSWRIFVESKNAYSLNLGFSKFSLPKNSQLFISNFKNTFGPFTASDNESHEQFWSPIFASDIILIELIVPKEYVEDVELQISHVNHDFLNILKSSADDCNIDVVCNAKNGFDEIDSKRNVIRSVGMYTIEGVSICTGFLVNNTSQDCTPYFMTANHCNVTSQNAPSIVAYWNYENSYCRPLNSVENGMLGDGNLNQFNTGAELIATWSDSDFTLLKLDDKIPVEANAYFSGWDITNNTPDESFIVHHPNLEEKRISFENDPVYLGDWGFGGIPVSNGDHFIVGSWEKGSTSDGSSGAPLFNRFNKVVGQLHGGLANCDNNEFDSFGRIFNSWTGGGSPSTSLKPWLDPINLGVLKLDGKGCNFNLELSENYFEICSSDSLKVLELKIDDSFSSDVNLSIDGIPNGVNAIFDNWTISPGETIKLTILNLNVLATGDYKIIINASDGINASSIDLDFKVFKRKTCRTYTSCTVK